MSMLRCNFPKVRIRMDPHSLSSRINMEKSWTSKGLQLLFYMFFGIYIRIFDTLLLY